MIVNATGNFTLGKVEKTRSLRGWVRWYALVYPLLADGERIGEMIQVSSDSYKDAARLPFQPSDPTNARLTALGGYTLANRAVAGWETTDEVLEALNRPI